MRFLLLVLSGFVSLVAMQPAYVAAGVPCIGTSTVVAEGSGTPSCGLGVAVMCPRGDVGQVLVTVTVRDCYGTPLGDLAVTVTPVNWRGRFCVWPGDTVWVGMTNAQGEVAHYCSKWGGCGDIQFSAVCAGVVLGPSQAVRVISPDINGTCVVDAMDFGIFAGRYGTNNSCTDYNCDGTVNAIDFGKFAPHFRDVLVL
jgi:hypothetical protein